MKHRAQPPRLRDDPEVGDLLREASERHWSSDRLGASGDAIARAIEATTTPSVESAGASASAASASAGASPVLKVALPAMLAGGVLTALLLPESDEPVARPSQAPIEAPAPASEEPVTLQEPPPAAPDAESERPAEKPRQKPHSRTVKKHRAPPPPPPPPPPRTAPSAAAIESALETQLGIFHAAKQAGEDGAYERGLSLLEELETRYPDTPLLPDVAVTRVHLLAASGKTDAALMHIDRLLSDEAQVVRTAQLLRLKADLLERAATSPASFSSLGH